MKRQSRSKEASTLEQRIAWSLAAGFTQVEAGQIERDFDETIARWNQRQKNGEGMDAEATRLAMQRMTDEQFIGQPGYGKKREEL